jgi:hypothetical protein
MLRKRWHYSKAIEAKMQSEQHFSRTQRALRHRKKGTFENLGWGGLAPWPPGSYAPATIVFCNENAKLSLMTVLALTYVIDFCDR